MLPIQKIHWPCKICNQIYKTEHHLEIHIFKQHNTTPKIFKCDICQKAFITSELLNSHRKIHFLKSYSKKIIDCLFCDKRFPRKGQVNYHLTRHTKEKPFFCQFCGQEFTSKFYRNQHQVRHHGNSEQFMDIKASVQMEQVKQDGLHGITPSTPSSSQSGMTTTIFKVEKVNEIVKQADEMVGGKKMMSDVGTMNRTSPSFKESAVDISARSQVSPNFMEVRSDMSSMNLMSPNVKEGQSDIGVALKLSPNGITEKKTDLNFDSIKMSSNAVKKSRNDRLVGAPRMIPRKTLRIPSKQRNYRCVICRQFTALEKISLQIHVRMVHLGLIPQKCDYCWKSFPTKTMLSSHVTNQHSNTAEKENN